MSANHISQNSVLSAENFPECKWAFRKYPVKHQPRSQALTSCGGKTLVGSGHVIS